MDPTVAKKFADYCDTLEELVETGKLPECVFPRMFYYGHTVVHSIFESNRKYKCIPCNKEIDYKSNNEHELYLRKCPECGSKEDDGFYDITGDWRLSKWECVKCKYQWVAEDGTKCPECGEIKKQ